jgi:long-chain acyl-CoA synthetase
VDTPTVKEYTLKFAKLYEKRAYIGTRKVIGEKKWEANYTWTTYDDALEISINFGSGLWAKGAVQQSIIGIYSENSLIWIHTIDASSLYGLVIASLYDTLGEESLLYLMRHPKIVAFVVVPRNVDKIVNLIVQDETFDDLIAIKLLILTDDSRLSYARDRLSAYSIEVTTFSSVCSLGSSQRQAYARIDSEDAHFICYSSDTTGKQKGIIVSYRAAVSTAYAAMHEIPLGDACRHLFYLPLVHIFERSAHWITVLVGGRLGFISSGIRTLTEDLHALRPTFLAAVPRVMNRFYDKVNEKLQGSALMRSVFWMS